MLRLARLAAALLLAGCAGMPEAPPRAPASADSAALGVALRLRAPIGGVTYAPDVLFLAPLDGERVVLDRGLVASSAAREDRVYFLEIPPGRYAVVAAMFRLRGLLDDGSVYLTYFGEALALRARATVEPGRFAYAGELSVAMATFVCPGEADALPLRVAEIVAPGVRTCGFAGLLSQAAAKSSYLAGRFYVTGGVVHSYRGSPGAAAREPLSRAAFLERAARDLGGTGWDAVAARPTP